MGLSIDKIPEVRYMVVLGAIGEHCFEVVAIGIEESEEDVIGEELRITDWNFGSLRSRAPDFVGWEERRPMAAGPTASPPRLGEMQRR